nr:nucleotidyltransferase substrate binding protein [Roseburia intestinalis]
MSGTSAKFSITFDLSWKVMKDILVEYYAMTGFIAGSPREVLKTSYKAELISDDTWIEMLKGGRLKPFYHISIPVDQKLRKVPFDIRGVTEIWLGAV